MVTPPGSSANAGMPFAGADVGGFFGNPSKELLTRWYQAGAFYPFFRAHAHIDAKRREPYLTGEPYVSIIRNAVRPRYSLLPAWYFAFHRASWDGMPLLRPMFVMFPNNEAGFPIDDQFFMGDNGLLVKSVVQCLLVYSYLMDRSITITKISTIYRGESTNVEIKTPLEKIPILMRGGHVFLPRDRLRRSSGLMKYDPFTVLVSVGDEGVAGGILYLDDGETYAYKKGEFIYRSFIYNSADNTVQSANLAAETAKNKFVKSMKGARIEKVILVGLNNSTVGKMAK